MRAVYPPTLPYQRRKRPVSSLNHLQSSKKHTNHSPSAPYSPSLHHQGINISQMRRREQEADEVSSPSPPTPPLALQRYQFSPDIVTLLKRLIKYDARSFLQMASELRDGCEAELRRLQQLKAKDKQARNRHVDNELSMVVIGNHLRAIADLKRDSEDQLRKLTPAKRTSEGEDSREALIVRRYEGIVGEMERNQAEIRRFMNSQVAHQHEIDFAACYRFFVALSKRLKKTGSEKLIQSRVYLLQTLTFFLGEAVRKWQPERGEQTLEEGQMEESIINRASNGLSEEGEEEQGNGQGVQGTDQQREGAPHESLSYDQINKWSRYSSRLLQDKMIELSGICEQIPQLQIFNRTLQFSQLENRQRVAFFRTVDVLISLHHKVSYLSRNKPHLLKELEHAQEELLFINTAAFNFLEQFAQEVQQIEPINFGGFDERKKSQLSEHFVQLRQFMVKLTEIVIGQDEYHRQVYEKTERLIDLVVLFSKVLAGENEFVEEWEEMMAALQQQTEQPVSEEEGRLIAILEECLEIQRARAGGAGVQREESAAKTNEELQQQVNKLIEDYQRLKGENRQLGENLQVLGRVREELLLEVEERDNMIKNLSGVKFVLEKKLNSQQGQSINSRQEIDQLKAKQHQAQKYLETSLLLREQLKVSENEREKLFQMVDSERQKYLRAYQMASRLKPEKERLQIENEQLRQRIETGKNEQLRVSNRLNKQITDLTNDRSLMEMQLETAERNNLKLMERLELSEKKLAEYSKLMILKLDDKEDGTMLRMEKDSDRLRKELEANKAEMAALDLAYAQTKDENSNLKIKLKELKFSQQEDHDKDEQIAELKAKLDKLNSKISNLNRENDQLHQKGEEVENKLKFTNRRVKQLESKERDHENDKKHQLQENEQLTRKLTDLQRKMDEERSKFERQTRANRQTISRMDLDLREKTAKIEVQQPRIRALQEQLAAKSQQAEQSTQQLTEVRFKQFETTIETHKLIELKLEEQARGLKQELDQKIEVEIKLNFEIDRLSQEIDRMRQQLERYIRELTEKETVIKLERQKNEEQVRKIREYQIEEKVREERGETRPHKHQDYTPSSRLDKPEEETHSRRGDSEQEYATPGRPSSKRIKEQNGRHRTDYNQDLGGSTHEQPFLKDRQRGKADKQVQINIERNDSLSKSTVKYDNYFNVKEYQRLANEFADYKLVVGLKIDELEKQLQENNRGKGQFNAEREQQERSREYERKIKEQEGVIRERQVKIKESQSRYRDYQSRISEYQAKARENTRIIHEYQSQKLQNAKQSESQNQRNAQLTNNLNDQLKQYQRERQQLISNLSSANQDRQAAMKELNQIKDQLNLSQTREREVKRELLKQRENNQKRPSDGNPQQTAQIDRLQKLLKETQAARDALTIKNRDLQTSKMTDSQKMSSQFDIQLKKQAVEKDKINLSLVEQIAKLKKEIKLLAEAQSNRAEDLQKQRQIEERDAIIKNLTTKLQEHEENRTKFIENLKYMENQQLEADKYMKMLKEENDRMRDGLNRQPDQAREAEWRQKMDEITYHFNELLRERDYIRNQYDGLRIHLEEETKRAIYLQGQLMKMQQDARQTNNINLEFYLEKIRSLEETVEAIGDELNDSRAALLNKDDRSIARSQLITQGEEQRNQGFTRQMLIVAEKNHQLFLENQKLRADLQMVQHSQGDWAHKQRLYLQELQSMSRQIITLKEAMHSGKLTDKQKVTTLPIDAFPQSSTYSENSMQDERNKGSKEASGLLSQLQQIIKSSLRWEVSKLAESLQRWGIPQVICQQVQDLRSHLMILCNCANALRLQYHGLLNLMGNSPSMQNLLEYVVRILAYFSQITLASPEASKIRSELTATSNSYTGGLFFTVLQEYTIHILENNAIEQYKRELRAKAKELLEIKQKLDELITRQIEQQQKICNRPQPVMSRRREINPYRESPLSSMGGSPSSLPK